MEATIVYDTAAKAQVIQPTGDFFSNFVLTIGIIAAFAAIVFLLRKMTQTRNAHEYQFLYKTVKPDHPAIARLRNRKD